MKSWGEDMTGTREKVKDRKRRAVAYARERLKRNFPKLLYDEKVLAALGENWLQLAKGKDMDRVMTGEPDGTGLFEAEMWLVERLAEGPGRLEEIAAKSVQEVVVRA